MHWISVRFYEMGDTSTFLKLRHVLKALWYIFNHAIDNCCPFSKLSKDFIPWIYAYCIQEIYIARICWIQYTNPQSDSVQITSFLEKACYINTQWLILLP